MSCRSSETRLLSLHYTYFTLTGHSLTKGRYNFIRNSKCECSRLNVHQVYTKHLEDWLLSVRTANSWGKCCFLSALQIKLGISRKREPNWDMRVSSLLLLSSDFPWTFTEISIEETGILIERWIRVQRSESVHVTISVENKRSLSNLSFDVCFQSYWIFKWPSSMYNIPDAKKFDSPSTQDSQKLFLWRGFQERRSLSISRSWSRRFWVQSWVRCSTG